MKIIFLLFFPFMALNVLADEPWPGIVHVFSGQPQHIYRQNNYLIEIKPLPITGGSGGRHYEITLSKDDKILGKTQTDAVFAFSVLDMNGDLPQLEAWSSKSYDNYTRLLYRWGGSKFNVVRIDDYVKDRSENNQKSYLPEWAKEYGFALTYRSTRMPQ